MKAFLIDFENVKSKGLTGIEVLTPEDKVIIFYSENSDTISFEMHRKVLTCKADIEYLKVRVGGKNALDFQLSTLLGYILAKGQYESIFIISGDKGFDKLHDFWNVSFADRNSITVFRTQTISAAMAFSMQKQPRLISEAEEDKEEITAPAVTEAPAAEVKETRKPKIAASVIDLTENIKPKNTAPAADLAENIKPKATAPAADLTENIKPKPAARVTRRTRRKALSAQELIRNALLGVFDLTDKDVEFIVRCAAESEDKEDLHNMLAKNYKGQATDLYKVLRPKYLRIKEALNTPAEETEPVAVAASAAVPEPETAPEMTAVPEEAPAAETEQANEEPAAEAEPQEAAEEEKPAKKKPARKRTSRSRKKTAKSALAAELEKRLTGQCTPEEIAAVTNIFEQTDSKQKLYLSIVKEYKKDRGCEIYKLIKSDYTALAKLKEEA